MTTETTTEEKKRKPIEANIDRECLKCGKHYKAKNSASKFCSDICRNTFNQSQKRKPNAAPLGSIDDKSPAFPKPVAAPTFTDIPAHLKIGVDLLTKEAQRWEDAFKDERQKRKDLQAKFEAQREELAKLKVDHQIEAIQNAKPSGLNGLAENPLVLKLMDHAGPALGAWLAKMADASNTSMTGTDGQLDDATAKQLHDINSWFVTLEEKQREEVYKLLFVLGQSKTPAIFNDTVLRLQNILKNGSIITPYQGYGTL